MNLQELIQKCEKVWDGFTSVEIKDTGQVFVLRGSTHVLRECTASDFEETLNGIYKSKLETELVTLKDSIKGCQEEASEFEKRLKEVEAELKNIDKK